MRPAHITIGSGGSNLSRHERPKRATPSYPITSRIKVDDGDIITTSDEEIKLPIRSRLDEAPEHDSAPSTPKSPSRFSSRRLRAEPFVTSMHDRTSDSNSSRSRSRTILEYEDVHLDNKRLVVDQKSTSNEDEVKSDPKLSDDSDSEYSIEEDSITWKVRMHFGRMVNNEWVQIGMICLIVVNALMMGLATFDFVMENPNVDDVFTLIDRGFLVVFTVECLMQLVYLGAALFADAWLVFDLSIVVLSWSLESLQVVRAFRIFRAFRLVTRVKPLRDLVLAIGAVMPRMYAIAALLLLIFYIFSVLFTELFSELPMSDLYFTTLDRSLFTCMEMMTLEWGDITREVMTHYPWAWAPFGSFIMITGFIVFNLIVAVVCDAVALTEKNVRQLDGFESDNPEHKLAEAQERIDLLQCHIHDMLRTQENVQELIEFMAAELLHLEAERMKAEHREAELRIEMERRLLYQSDMNSTTQIQSLERNYIQVKEKREYDRKVKELKRKASLQAEEDSLHKGSRDSRILPTIPNPLDRKKTGRRNSGSTTRNNFLSSFKRSSSQELSNKSLEDMTAPSSTRSLAKDSSKTSFRSQVSG